MHFEKNKPLMDYTKLKGVYYQYTVIEITFSIHGF
jgi:hypothetical protein